MTAEPGRTHNAAMTAAIIEPGLLKLFRWFVAIRIAFLGLVWLSIQDAASITTRQVPVPGIVVSVALLIYLGSSWLRERMGRAYLPVALAVATLGPIVEHSMTVAARLDAGEGVNEAVADYWLLFFVLLVPLIFVAWQYRFRAVVLFSLGVTLLDGARLGAQIEGTNAGATAVGALLVGRGLLFVFVGYFITSIVRVQRQQQRELVQHAATVEQLATSRERNRLARELHDTLAHTLSAMAVQLEGAKSLWDDDPSRARSMVDRSLEGARSGLDEARRAIDALRASALEELGLVGALEKIATDMNETTSVAVLASVTDVGEIDPSLEQVTYRIADEALTNVVRHSQAAYAQLELRRDRDRMILVVKDDGVGFDPEAALEDGHLGLAGMRERATLIGGALDIESSPGEGATVRFEVAVPR